MTTIYDALAERLGRKPTHEETKEEVKRILDAAWMRRSISSPSAQLPGRTKRVRA